MMKRLLVPVDFSPVTKAVAEVAATMAAACGAKVFLVHVAPAFVPDLKTVKVPQAERDLLAGKLREEHREIQALAESLQKRGCDAEALLVEGHGTVDKILDEARRREVDMIIVGSHGHGRLYDMLVGSVGEGVLRHARIPVLVVPDVKAKAGDSRSTEAS